MNLHKAKMLIYGGEKCWSSIKTLAPCESACPIGMKVPDYLVAAAQEKFEESYWIMRDSTPFVALCGYVCHHPCESLCSRGRLDEPINIRGVKRFIGDYALEKRIDKPSPFPKKGKRVAVVGSGPAGLSAAYTLASKGYEVTVFESNSSPGGMMITGIPPFVLPRRIVDSHVCYVEASGVEFKLGVTIGRDLQLTDFFQQGFSAVFLAVGARLSQGLAIEGMEARGVIPAMSLMEQANMGYRVDLGAKALIIGGGNVAVDAARTVIRLGVRDVRILCPEKREEMPAFDWEIQRAEEEGVTLHNSLAPVGLVVKDGSVKGVHLRTVKKLEFDRDGRITPMLEEDGEAQFMAADNIVFAIGQRPDTELLEGVQTTPRGSLSVDPETMETNHPGVFAGGDAVSINGTVVDALADGKRAALAIDRYLHNLPRPRPVNSRHYQILEEPLPQFVEKRKRMDMTELSLADRIDNFQMVEDGLSVMDAVYEANRCLHCSMCGHCMFELNQCCYNTGTRLL